jgi:RNA polymerase sigma factor (sigma-70 family)
MHIGMDDPADSSAREPGTRLSGRSGRLRLLVASLAGPAVRSRFELDDLVQEVFLRALADPARIPIHDAELDRHLSLLARHVVVDAARCLRAAKREGELGAGSLSAASTNSGSTGSAPFQSRLRARSPGPSTQAAQRELSSDLVAGFLRLAPEHRRVLGLRQFQGLSAAESARRMGRSEVAVHSLYRRALEAWGHEVGGGAA